MLNDPWDHPPSRTMISANWMYCLCCLTVGIHSLLMNPWSRLHIIPPSDSMQNSLSSSFHFLIHSRTMLFYQSAHDLGLVIGWYTKAIPLLKTQHFSLVSIHIPLFPVSEWTNKYNLSAINFIRTLEVVYLSKNITFSHRLLPRNTLQRIRQYCRKDMWAPGEMRKGSEYPSPCYIVEGHSFKHGIPTTCYSRVEYTRLSVSFCIAVIKHCCCSENPSLPSLHVYCLSSIKSDFRLQTPDVRFQLQRLKAFLKVYWTTTISSVTFSWTPWRGLLDFEPCVPLFSCCC